LSIDDVERADIVDGQSYIRPLKATSSKNTTVDGKNYSPTFFMTAAKHTEKTTSREGSAMLPVYQ
jgi:hypothetical protein